VTPIRLFEYFAAIGGGLFVIGLCLFILFLLFVTVAAWAKRPAPPVPQREPLSSPYDERNVVTQ
jgi:hypothetical protein